jgi:hypothetical protein
MAAMGRSCPSWASSMAVRWRLGINGLQNRPHYLTERHRGVDLAVCDCPQRFDFLKVCQESAGLLG